MTPLSTQAETGSANREAVAIAAGWEKRSVWVTCEGDRTRWIAPGVGSVHVFHPDYQRDLPATLAEIERRGWGCSLATYPKPSAMVWGATDGAKPRWISATGTTIAHAACAALLLALEQQP
jgi:hypothetical protein